MGPRGGLPWIGWHALILRRSRFSSCSRPSPHGPGCRPRDCRGQAAGARATRTRAPVSWGSVPASDAPRRWRSPAICRRAIARSRIDQQIRALTDRLRRYSPHVEPSPDMPGVFWLDAQGLNRLYPRCTCGRRPSASNCSAPACGRPSPSGSPASARMRSPAITRAPRCARRPPKSAARCSACRSQRRSRSGCPRAPARPRHRNGRRFPAPAGRRHPATFRRRDRPAVPAGIGSPLGAARAGSSASSARAPRAFRFSRVAHRSLIFIVKRLLDSLLAALMQQAHAVLELELEMKLDDARFARNGCGPRRRRSMRCSCSRSSACGSKRFACRPAS